MFKKVLFLLSLGISGFICPARKPLVIFDLGGVCIETKGGKAFKELGISLVMHFAVMHLSQLPRISSYIKNDLYYRFLNTIEPRNPQEAPAYDPDGVLIPQLMCNWHKGIITNAALKSRIHGALETCTQMILRPSEKQLIRAMSTMMFTPSSMIKTQELIPGMYELVLWCKQNGFDVAILSNWDDESFQLLRKKFTSFFDLFENNIFVSGNMGLIKPNPLMFTMTLWALSIDDPSGCVFVDDRLENIQAAQALGISTIHALAEKKKHSKARPNIIAIQQQLQDFRNSFQTAQA